MGRVSQPNKRKLTEIIVRQARPKPGNGYCIWDTHTRGLALRVRPSGRKVWMAVYRAGGKPQWYRIGDASTIGLADARVMTAEVMLSVAKGANPAAERRAKRSSGTFGELAAKYVEEHSRKHNKSWKQGAYLVEIYATARWRDLPAAAITRTDVRGVLVKLRPVMSNQVLAAISAVFSWGVREEHVTANPCRLVERNATQSRERVLSKSEVPLLWDALDDVVDPISATALKLILLSGARPGEVTHMRHEHIKDGEWWELPGAPSEHWPGTKNHKAHRLPLSAPVRALIEALADGEAPATGYVFEYERGRPVPRLDKPMRELSAKLGIEAITPHDLRRSFASTVASLGFGRQAIDRLLNHADHSIAGVYDRYSYAKEDQVIMEAVATKIIGLVEGRAADNVVQLRQ